jgi:hypothetical protein
VGLDAAQARTEGNTDGVPAETDFAIDDAHLRDFDALGDAPWFQEDFDGWRQLSRQTRATIRIARRLHEGKLGTPADWDALPFIGRLVFMDHLAKALDPLAGDFISIPEPPSAGARAGPDGDAMLVGEAGEPATASTEDEPDDGPEDEWGEPIAYDPEYRRAVEEREKGRLAESFEFQRIVLAGAVNYWLRLGGVRPRFTWVPDRPLVHLDGDGLFGALAVQILFDCSRTDGLAVCSSCGTPFLPGPRRPRRDRNTYCSDCGVKAAARDAAARYRQTEKYRATYETWAKKRGSSTA